MSIETDHADGTCVIASDVPDDIDVAVHLDLTVPTGIAVERVQTGKGTVSVTDVGGDVTCRTRNGDVSVEAVEGYVTLESTNRTVTARDTTGVDGAETSNGNVRVDVHDLRQDVRLAATNGNVTAAVDPDLAMAVSLDTVNGEVTVRGLDLTRRESGDRRVDGQLGDGDPEHTLVAETSNGTVTIKSL